MSHTKYEAIRGLFYRLSMALYRILFPCGSFRSAGFCISAEISLYNFFLLRFLENGIPRIIKLHDGSYDSNLYCLMLSWSWVIAPLRYPMHIGFPWVIFHVWKRAAHCSALRRYLLLNAEKYF